MEGSARSGRLSARCGPPPLIWLDNRVICFPYQVVDQRRRRLATLQVLLYGGHRNFGEHESRATQLHRAGAAECIPREPPQARLEAPRLIGDGALERRRPIALDEIVAAVEQQQSRIVQMPAHPGRSVKRGAKSITGVN